MARKGSIAQGPRRREVLLAVGIALALAMASVGTAVAAEAPRWELTAVPTPTHVAPEAPRDEEQQVTVSASGGTFVLEVLGAGDSAYEPTRPLAYDATAAEVQAALEAARVEVSVTGGPGGSAPYDVTFEGGEAAMALKPMRADGAGLQGGGASVSELRRGANAPELVLTAINVGGESTNGGPVTISDVLPSWLHATAVEGFAAYQSKENGTGSSEAPLTCSTASVTCTYEAEPVDPGDQLVMEIRLASGAAPPAEALNSAEVSGGGAAPYSVTAPLGSSSAPVEYGFAPGSVFAAASMLRAGEHPSVTTGFELATDETDTTVADPKDIRFDLPPGLVGSTVGMPRCTMHKVIAGGEGEADEVCPADTMVGTATVTLGATGDGFGRKPERFDFTVPVYNIAPSPGEPAAFGFDAVIAPVRLDTSVLSNGNYAVRVTAPDLAQTLAVLSSVITIWGVPSEHSGPGTHGDKTLTYPESFGAPSPGQSPVPLLTNPQQCAAPIVGTAETDAWATPGAFRTALAPMGTLSGCDVVSFASSFSFLPDTLEAAEPAGYTFELNVPQLNTAGLAARSSIKDVALTLPEGVVVNPSAATGLKACSSEQFYGPGHPSQEPAAPASCPREAQVGEVEVETPDLEHTLKGQVFLGTPECSPCTSQDAADGKMVRLFVQLVGEGESGIVVKLEGRADLNQQTGQIETVFEETPQVPFSKLRFVLEGGSRAVLANPRKCGTVKSAGVLTPWSSELAAGEPGTIGDSTPSYEFDIDQNCFGPKFKPTLKAGVPNIQAGQHGEFTLAFGREDDEQFLKQITLHMPPGLLGTLTGVELCKEAQANAGSCGANSLIGEAQVLTGPGANPFLVEGGKVYLTEGYGGSQYGLSILVPAVAGPYTLGGISGEGKEADDGTVVVRTQLFIDRHTAAITAVSGPVPQMLDGIPLQLKAVDVKLNRPGFIFNPTNCEKMTVSGAIASWEGMSAEVSSPFQVTNCARLGFAPTFVATTSGKTSRKRGASLHVRLAYPAGSQASQANVREVKVELPRALPSRLEPTLKHACTAQQFASNPAACPEDSLVGTAKVKTQVLPVALEGPAYFVSHGGEAFPNLIVILQGYGVTVELVGDTLIKDGVTSTTFTSAPDVPFESFELTLPEGSHSALAANTHLCQHKLVMPTYMVGQNGATLEHRTVVQVEGCANKISLLGEKLKSGMLALKVTVPAAGKLTAAGAGLDSASRSSSGREEVTLELRVKQTAKRTHAGRGAHAKHGLASVKTTIGLTFKPTKGKKLIKKVKVKI